MFERMKRMLLLVRRAPKQTWNGRRIFGTIVSLLREAKTHGLSDHSPASHSSMSSSSRRRWRKSKSAVPVVNVGPVRVPVAVGPPAKMLAKVHGAPTPIQPVPRRVDALATVVAARSAYYEDEEQARAQYDRTTAKLAADARAAAEELKCNYDRALDNLQRHVAMETKKSVETLQANLWNATQHRAAKVAHAESIESKGGDNDSQPYYARISWRAMADLVKPLLPPTRDTDDAIRFIVDHSLDDVTRIECDIGRTLGCGMVKCPLVIHCMDGGRMAVSTRDACVVLAPVAMMAAPTTMRLKPAAHDYVLNSIGTDGLDDPATGITVERFQRAIVDVLASEGVAAIVRPRPIRPPRPTPASC